MKRKFNITFYKFLFISIFSLFLTESLSAATSHTKTTVMKMEQEIPTSSKKLLKSDKVKRVVMKQVNILKNTFKKLTKYIAKTKKTSEFGIGIFLITMVIFGVALALLGLFAEMWWLLIVIGLLFLLMF